MTLINKNLGAVPRSTVEKLKAILELLGPSGAIKLEPIPGTEVDIPVSDDLSINVKTPNTLFYDVDGDDIKLRFKHRPLVKYKGSKLLSKYIKSVGVSPDEILIDMGIVKAHLNVEDK